MSDDGRGPATTIVALAGGVGGAKLVRGLALATDPRRLTAIVNTGDDFEHLGLHVSPDLDSVMYALAGSNDTARGWGLAGESWAFMDQVARLGGPDWFRLGDRDLATHVLRTEALRRGAPLGRMTRDLARRFGVRARLLPMSDDPVRTAVLTRAGALPFQHYFVRERARPRVTGFAYEGAGRARANADALAALRRADLGAIVICPSNPFISIDPIRAVPEMARALARRTAPLVAVSPIVGGRAIKGPAAKMLRELGQTPSATAVAHHYGSLLDGFVLDRVDADQAPAIAASGVAVMVGDTVMTSDADRARLAREVLAFAARLDQPAP